jgi:hypothetical protein
VQEGAEARAEPRQRRHVHADELRPEELDARHEERLGGQVLAAVVEVLVVEVHDVVVGGVTAEVGQERFVETRAVGAERGGVHVVHGVPEPLQFGPEGEERLRRAEARVERALAAQEDAHGAAGQAAASAIQPSAA